MAAACARALCKVGWTFLESPAARRSGTVSVLLGNAGSRGSRRAYGSGSGGFRPPLLSPAGGGRLLGCAFLLGGGLGLVQTVRSSAGRHRAEEEAALVGVGRGAGGPVCGHVVCRRGSPTDLGGGGGSNSLILLFIDAGLSKISCFVL